MFKYTFQFVPYWTYLIGLICTILLFSLFALYTRRFLWYLITAPALFLLYTFLLHIPMLLGAIMVIILTWRYMILRQTAFLEYEKVYLQWATFLVLISVLFLKEYMTIIYLISLLLIFIIGNITIHLLSMKDYNKKQYTLHMGKLFVYITLTITVLLTLLHFVGMPALFILWDVVIVNLWNIITSVFIYVMVILLYGVEFIIQLIPKFETEVGEVHSAEFGLEAEELFKLSTQESNYPHFSWIIGIILFGFILYKLIKLFGKKFNLEQTNESQTKTYHSIKENENKKSLYSRITKRFVHQTNHPVRKLMYQFERKTENVEKGRKPYETLQEWFQRIGLEADIHIYEQVRYGEVKTKREDIQKLTKQLKEWFVKQKKGEMDEINQTSKE